MKTAIIYYSLDGNCALIADIIKAALNVDVFEIKTKDNKKRRGFAKIVWGVLQVMTKKKPELLPLAVDINAYDLIILGTPVWAGSPAPAIVSFLSNTAISGKKTALFCCHGGGMGVALEKFKALLPGNTVISEIDFVYPAKNEGDALKQKTGEWVKNLAN